MPSGVQSSGEIESSHSFSEPATVVKVKDFCQEGGSLPLNSRTLELHLSFDALERLLKEGRPERESSGSYQIMEDASKEIEQTHDAKTFRKEDEEASDLQSLTLNIPADIPLVIKRKRGRPRKGTYPSKPLQPQHSGTTSTLQNLVHGSLSGKASGKNLTSPLQSDSIEDHAEGDTDSEIKPKRNRRSKVLHDDYVADFNTSDEEEGGEMFRKFSGRGRGRGRKQNCEFPEAFEDFFSSYNEFFGRKSLSGDECVDHSIFEDLDECENEEQSLPKDNQSQGSPISKCEVKDGIEGVIGPGGQTQVKIVNSGDMTVIDGEENFIYNIITTTGERKSIIPIVVPKMGGEVLIKVEGNEPPLPSTTTDNDDEGTIDSILSGNDVKSLASSSEMQHTQQQKDRALYRQVASLKQKYYQALQELKKRPQVATLADLVYGAASFLTEEQLVFFTLQLKSGCPNMPGIKFSVREKMLGLAFYLQSPTLYKWLGLKFHLPSKLILERWLEGLARNNPDDVKKLIYNIYTRHIFRA